MATSMQQWSSRFAFVLAASGSAIGLGNLWKFPYIAGENGGGAFVWVYLLCVLLIGLPVMMSEILPGRKARANPITAMQVLAVQAQAQTHWRYLGWMGAIAGVLILSFYSVIAGWAMGYSFKALGGNFSDATPEHIHDLFQAFLASPAQLIFWHSLFTGATVWIVGKGVSAGLERAVRFFMPCLFVLLMLLVAYAMTSGSYLKGLHFLFYPDFSQLTRSGVLTAMGHAFFTLSLGMGAMMAYGAYLPKEISIVKTACLVAFADTFIALLAGLAIFPLVFEYDLHPASGPGLVFETLPLAFGKMTGGWLAGVLFFVLLFVAAITSAISLIEPAVAWLEQTHRIERRQGSFYVGGMVWLLGLGSVFSFNIWADVHFFGLTFFGLLDYLTTNLLLPIGGFAIAVFVGWKMPREHAQSEYDTPREQGFALWYFLVRYIAPAGIFLVFLHVVGVMR